MAPAPAVVLVGNLPDVSGAIHDFQDFEILRAPSLGEAVDRIRAGNVKLIVCDYDNLSPIRAENGHVPIIVLGRRLHNAEMISAMEKAFAYLDPPFDQDYLRDLIREALENPDFMDSIRVESRSPNFISLRLRCTFATADRLMRFATLMKPDIPEEERRQAATAFREMLLNAIEHGGGLNPNQWVRVSRVRSKRAVFYYIQDPGEGFSRDDLKHAAVSNPEDEPDHHMRYRAELGLRSGGFGILLAQNLVDEVIYNEQGNSVVLIKYLD